MRCKETRKREKHTAPSTEKELLQKCPENSKENNNLNGFEYLII